MYRVEWFQSALDELMLLWMHSSSELRALITRAAHEIELKLQKTPFQFSEPRPRMRRAAFAGPLGVSFRVEEDDATVTIIHVWIILPHQSNGQQGAISG